MEYKVDIPIFNGPLDLLLHLVKKTNINILDIDINEITKQYLDYINKMQEMNLNIASEYLVMACELLVMKSSSLLPKIEDEEDEYEENTKENLINRLLEYEKYKNMTDELKQLENIRKEVYTKEADSLNEYKDEYDNIDYNVSLTDLMKAFEIFLNDKELEKPLNTKVTNKEYSIKKRCNEIKNLITERKKINFNELFEEFNKSYVVITFLAILNLSRKQEIEIEQDNNFKNITIKKRD